MMQLRKATRTKLKMRVSLAGVSGSGKTLSALYLAKGLVGDWSKIGIIDTENRADIYADIGGGEYNVLPMLPPFSPERMVEAIKALEEAGMDVIIIDSASSEWDGEGGANQINDSLANVKYKGNSWAAWNETTPRHNKFLEKIRLSPSHVITTLMAKEETVQSEGRIKRLGMKEVQREGFRRDMILAFLVDHESHKVVTLKDNTFLFKTTDPFLITEETGELLKDWAEKGINASDLEPKVTEYQRKTIFAQGKELGKTSEETKAMVKDYYKLESFNHMTEKQAAAMIRALNKKLEEVK